MPWYIYATFTQNFWLASGRWHVWLSPTWSLAIEEQFYLTLTLPLLIWMLPPKHLWKFTIAGVIAVVGFRPIAYMHFCPQCSEAASPLSTVGGFRLFVIGQYFRLGSFAGPQSLCLSST